MTQTIDFTTEPHRNAAWTVVAMIGPKVVAFEQFENAPASKDEMWAIKNKFAELPEIVAAQEAFFAMPDDADEEELSAAQPLVVFGMVSGGRFTFNLNKGDMKKAGLAHLA